MRFSAGPISLILILSHATMCSSLFCFIALSFVFIPVSASFPFIVLHGIGDYCSSAKVKNFTQELIHLAKSEGFCLEIGDGFVDSWFKPMQEQVQTACSKVKQMKELQKGYHIVGLSQGNLIGRGIVELCDGGPPVINFVSLGGPNAGIASVPLCGTGEFCIVVDNLIKSGVYRNYVQRHLAPSGYMKLPYDIPNYLSNCRFLPMLNNELPNMRNATYKERFASLHNLVLIMFENETVLTPKETSWFGFYPDGAFSPILPPQQTKLYTEDWIGLKRLDEGGKVKYIRVPGKHIEISIDDMKKHVVPYLTMTVKESTGQ